jgi:hypothetical protein
MLSFAVRVKWFGLLVSLLILVPSVVCAQRPARVVHVFVALADNRYQGIEPVPARLGDGDTPASNLYWGAAFGVKTYFRSSSDWKLVSAGSGPKAVVLERCVFKNRSEDVYVVGDAYRGRDIRDAITDFLDAASGLHYQILMVRNGQSDTSLSIGGGADLVAYVGHDAFMDFQISPVSGIKGKKSRAAIMLACASKPYFGPYLKYTGADPLLWTTGLMAPEAYTLQAAIDGWIAGENGDSVRMRAARAYDKYQHCGLQAAERLFATGW